MSIPMRISHGGGVGIGDNVKMCKHCYYTFLTPDKDREGKLKLCPNCKKVYVEEINE